MNRLALISAVVGTITGFAAVMTVMFGDLPTIAVSTDIEDVNTHIDDIEMDLKEKIALNESFMLDEAIDILQDRIWANVDRQQTYLDKNKSIPANLREQLRGLEHEMEKLKLRRNRLP